MSLLAMVQDGPLAGEAFTISSCPQVVRCVRGMDGKADILNLPEDEPALGEEVHWYRWDGTASGHVCMRRPRRCLTTITLMHVPLEVFPAPRTEDCGYGCCKAGDVGICSELVRPAAVGG